MREETVEKHFKTLKQLHVARELCAPHTSTSICWQHEREGKGVCGTRLLAPTSRISLLELVLSGKVLCLTTFSSRTAKMKHTKPMKVAPLQQK